MTSNRPYVVPRNYTWKSGNGEETPGIGLLCGKKFRAHLTPDEAYGLALTLVNLADALKEQDH